MLKRSGAYSKGFAAAIAQHVVDDFALAPAVLCGADVIHVDKNLLDCLCCWLSSVWSVVEQSVHVLQCAI